MRKWLFEHVVSPIPVVGPFFHNQEWSSRVYMLGMSCSMLFVGTWLMTLNVAGRTMDDSAAMTYAKSLGNMFFAMAVSGVTYSVSTNVLKNVGLFLTEGCREEMHQPIEGLNWRDPSKENL